MSVPQQVQLDEESLNSSAYMMPNKASLISPSRGTSQSSMAGISMASISLADDLSNDLRKNDDSYDFASDDSNTQVVRIAQKDKAAGKSSKRFPSSYMATNLGLLESVEEIDDAYREPSQQ